MPHLIYFIPCAKAITDAEDRTISLVSVFDGLQVNIPASGTFSPDAVIPIVWSAVAFWSREPSDERKKFEQRMSIVMPDGNENINGIIPLDMATRVFRATIKLNAFPVSQAGEYRLRLFIRDVSEGDKWRAVSEYPVMIEHVGGTGA